MTLSQLLATPYDASNPSGYITSIASSDVVTALGFTPYNATNPAGYTTNTGTVTSVGVSASGTYAGAITVAASPVTTAGTITITPNVFTTSTPGVVPGSGGGTSNFMRADGTWAAPTSSAIGSSTQIAYNSGGTETGSAALTFDGTYTLTLGTTSGATITSPVLAALTSFLITSASSTTTTGSIKVVGQATTGAGAVGGYVYVTGGTSSSAAGGSVVVAGGTGGAYGGATLTLAGGVSSGATATLQAGSSSGTGGNVLINGGTGPTNGGAVIIQTATGGNSPGERMRITPTGALAFNGSTNYGSLNQVLTSAGNAVPTWSDGSGIPQLGLAGSSNSAIIPGGSIVGTGPGGIGGASVRIFAQQSNSGTAGSVLVSGGNAYGGGATGGNTYIKGGDGDNNGGYGNAGNTYITGGASAGGDTYAGFISIQTGGALTERLRITNTGGFAFGGATNYGTSGQVLTSNGNAVPTWSSAPAASAGSLTGTTLASNVVTSSLTSVGTLTSLAVTGNITAADPTLSTQVATKNYVDTQVISAEAGPTVVVVSATTQTAVANAHYIMTATSGTSTLTLPASPSVGAIVWVANFTGRTDLNIAGNGANIMASSANMIVNQNQVNVQLRYINSTLGWIIL